MDLTISLDETQAARLQRQAATRRLSPEQAATELLGLLLAQLDQPEATQRRLELIRKSRTAGLTPAESQELQDLESAIDQMLAPLDRQLLSTAEQFRRLAEGLPDAVHP